MAFTPEKGGKVKYIPGDPYGVDCFRGCYLLSPGMTPELLSDVDEATCPASGPASLADASEYMREDDNELWREGGELVELVEVKELELCVGHTFPEVPQHRVSAVSLFLWTGMFIALHALAVRSAWVKTFGRGSPLSVRIEELAPSVAGKSMAALVPRVPVEFHHSCVESSSTGASSCTSEVFILTRYCQRGQLLLCADDHCNSEPPAWKGRLPWYSTMRVTRYLRPQSPCSALPAMSRHEQAEIQEICLPEDPLPLVRLGKWGRLCRWDDGKGWVVMTKVPQEGEAKAKAKKRARKSKSKTKQKQKRQRRWRRRKALN
ncbi:unnamed protein product [Chrysoparadoxa australica]